MHQYQERDGEEDRKPGGKTRVKENMESVRLKEDRILCWSNFRGIFFLMNFELLTFLCR